MTEGERKWLAGGIVRHKLALPRSCEASGDVGCRGRGGAALPRRCVGLGGGRGEARTKAEGGYYFFFFPPSFFFFFFCPPANPLGATLARQDAFFIQPPRPGSVKLHFFSEAL